MLCSKVIQLYILFLKNIIFHYGLSQVIKYSSLCYTVGPCCLTSWLLNLVTVNSVCCSIYLGLLKFLSAIFCSLQYINIKHRLSGLLLFCIYIKWYFCLFCFVFLFFKIYLFIYLFWAVLGLRFCARAFSSHGKRGPLFIAVRGPLTIAASLVAEHKLQTRRLSSCGSRAQLLRGMWDPPRSWLEPVSPALAGGFSTTAPPGKP